MLTATYQWPELTRPKKRSEDAKHMMKQILKRALGAKLLGIMDYYRYPHSRASWGGALNGQEHRQQMVETFIRRLPIDAIVETGTYRGTTTTYLASLTSLPIYTVELNRRLHGFGWAALWRFKNIHRFNGDSRPFLRKLTANKKLCQKTILFYLDAHWNADLPLAEELEIIFRHWKRAVVLIDDFQVIDDPGYNYDDYGSGKGLTIDYIQPAIKQFGLCAFYPSLSSLKETGAKRGSITLAADSNLKQILDNMNEIREYRASEIDPEFGGTGVEYLRNAETI